jgi:hypothetical protein
VLESVPESKVKVNPLFDHPVLFSRRVKASCVETFLLPEQTNSVIIDAKVVPTTEPTRINIHEEMDGSLAVDDDVENVDTSNDPSRR